MVIEHAARTMRQEKGSTRVGRAEFARVPPQSEPLLLDLLVESPDPLVNHHE